MTNDVHEETMTDGAEAQAGDARSAGGPIGQAGRTVAHAVSGVAGAVAGTAQLAREQLPQVMEQGGRMADTTAQVAAVTADRLRHQPDEPLTLGSSFMFGVALGLFIAGAPRLIVGLALTPALAMGATLLERRPNGRRAAGT